MRGAAPANWRFPARQGHGLEDALVPEFRLVINLLRLGGFLLAGGLLFVLTHSNSALRWRAAGALGSNLLDFPAVYNNLSWLGYVLLPGQVMPRIPVISSVIGKAATQAGMSQSLFEKQQTQRQQ